MISTQAWVSFSNAVYEANAVAKMSLNEVFVSYIAMCTGLSF